MEVDEVFASKFNKFINRRVEGEPNAYITGIKEFYSKNFIVGKDVLIPRPETELVVDEALKIIPVDREYRVADPCSGSGCIGIVLASMRKNISLISTDLYFDAARTGAYNTKLNRTDNNSIFINANLIDCIKDGSLDMVVCNPPYVADRDFSQLQDEIKKHEPRRALVSGEDGFSHIKEIVFRSKEKLKNDGWLILEIGEGQSRKTVKLFELAGYREPSVTLDINKVERVVKAQCSAY